MCVCVVSLFFIVGDVVTYVVDTEWKSYCMCLERIAFGTRTTDVVNHFVKLLFIRYCVFFFF